MKTELLDDAAAKRSEPARDGRAGDEDQEDRRNPSRPDRRKSLRMGGRRAGEA